MNLLATSLLTLTTIFSSVSLSQRGPLSKTTNLTQYPYSSVATNYYRTTENKTIFTPLALVIDLTEDTGVYDMEQDRIISNTAFRSNWSGVELSLLSNGGAYRNPSFRYTMDFNFTSTNLAITNTFVNAGTTTNSTINTLYNNDTNYHTFFIEFKFTANGTGSDVIVRWGSTIITIPTPFTSNVWEIADAGDNGHNVAWRMFSNGSSRSVSSWTSGTETTDFRFVDFASAEDSYYSDLALWFYELGQYESDSTALIRGFSAMVGILINFSLVFLNLTIFDISLMSIFGILLLFVGIIWILKLIRG
jgi:hypothetical protein